MAKARKLSPPTGGVERRSRCFAEALLEYTQLHVHGLADEETAPFHACARRWLARWEMKALESIDGVVLSSYFHELLQKDVSPEELQREGRFLKGFFDWVVRVAYLEKSPLDALPPLRWRRNRRALVWEEAEQEALLAACRPTGEAIEDEPGSVLWYFFSEEHRSRSRFVPAYLFPMVLLGLRTGLRLGSLIHLTWDQVRFERSALVIAAADTRWGKPLEIALDDECLGVLREIVERARRRCPMPRRVFDALDLPYVNGVPDDRVIQGHLRAACQRAGVREAEFNSLRHTFAASCARRGMPLEKLETLVDWDDQDAVARIHEKFGPVVIPLLSVLPDREPGDSAPSAPRG
jgi:integrase